MAPQQGILQPQITHYVSNATQVQALSLIALDHGISSFSSSKPLLSAEHHLVRNHLASSPQSSPGCRVIVIYLANQHNGNLPWRDADCQAMYLLSEYSRSSEKVVSPTSLCSLKMGSPWRPSEYTTRTPDSMQCVVFLILLWCWEVC